MTFDPAVVERVYRALATPKPLLPKPTSVAAEKKTITRSDVDDIIQRKRSASPVELQEILDSKELKLTSRERSQISIDLTIVMAARSRAANGRRENPNARFIAQVLGYTETPFGLIERSFIQDVLRSGSENIQRCRSHKPPLCVCWSSQRAILYEASAHGEKSPEGWAARRLYETLEQLETASRLEPEPTPKPPDPADYKNTYLFSRRYPYQGAAD